MEVTSASLFKTTFKNNLTEISRVNRVVCDTWVLLIVFISMMPFYKQKVYILFQQNDRAISVLPQNVINCSVSDFPFSYQLPQHRLMNSTNLQLTEFFLKNVLFPQMKDSLSVMFSITAMKQHCSSLISCFSQLWIQLPKVLFQQLF